ncbi:MAG TPA: NAD(P)-dependent oxidoreductase [Thermoanaerobaculia bacterium]
MNVLVTGATGVVGRRLVPLLIGDGHRVAAIARAPGKREDLARIGATPVNADLFAPESLRRAASGCDAIVNLATHMPATFAQSIRRNSWRENDRVRRVGSANLLEAALAEGVVRFVQESFAPAYPDCGDRWIEETMPLEPVRYNESILDAEKSATRFTEAGGTGVVLRFAGFYGPDSRFLAEIIRQVRRGRAPLPGPPNAFVSSVSHDDAATAAAAALALPSGIYNVADDEPVTHRGYFDSLARALGVPPPKLPPRWMAWFLGSLGEMMSRSLKISNRKLKASSPWRPMYPSVREGWPTVVASMPAESEDAA